MGIQFAPRTVYPWKNQRSKASAKDLLVVDIYTNIVIAICAMRCKKLNRKTTRKRITKKEKNKTEASTVDGC